VAREEYNCVMVIAYSIVRRPCSVVALSMFSTPTKHANRWGPLAARTIPDWLCLPPPPFLSAPPSLSLCYPSSGWNRKPRIRHGPGSVRAKRTMVGEHDVQLSDSQRQCIVVACALLRKSAILLLVSRCCAPSPPLPSPPLLP
jgi:hypothetical protein